MRHIYILTILNLKFIELMFKISFPIEKPLLHLSYKYLLLSPCGATAHAEIGRHIVELFRPHTHTHTHTRTIGLL